MFLASIGWIYILSGSFWGLVSQLWAHWFFISAVVAGISAVIIHSVELSVALKKERFQELSKQSIIWRTMVFGAIWWIRDE